MASPQASTVRHRTPAANGHSTNGLSPSAKGKARAEPAPAADKDDDDSSSSSGAEPILLGGKKGDGSDGWWQKYEVPRKTLHSSIGSFSSALLDRLALLACWRCGGPLRDRPALARACRPGT